MPLDDPTAAAAQAAAELAELTGSPSHDLALVLGSGWLPAVDLLGETLAEFPSTDLHGFAPPAVAGHAGKIRSVATPSGGRALVFLGPHALLRGPGCRSRGARRAHLGCGRMPHDRAHQRVRRVEPGAGRPGTPVLISDHINMTGASPLRGATFIDLTDLYSARLRTLCRQIDPTLAEGVYLQFRGPQYETPAEVRMAGVLGADLVGHVAPPWRRSPPARPAWRSSALSLVTNLAAGMTGEALNHEEVLEAGKMAAERMGGLLATVVGQL